MNNVTVIGNLTDDPELRFTPSGLALAKFSVADNYKKDDTEKVSFFNVVVWGDQAENLTESLKKGMRVIVVGRVEQQRWETDTGDKRSTVQIVATDIGPALRFAQAKVMPITREGTAPAAAPAAPAATPDEAPF